MYVTGVATPGPKDIQNMFGVLRIADINPQRIEFGKIGAG
jgi:hypothetical protein